MGKMRYNVSSMRMMLSISMILLFQLSFLNFANAQKYACVNTDYVLSKLPDYVNAQQRLDRYVADWQQELTDKMSEIAAMRVEYEQESYLLPENLKKRRQEELQQKELEVRTLQQQRFGEGGDLDRKRAELLRPIQDRVYSTIERVAHEKNYAFVFDKSGSNTLLFVSKKYDISDEVLELLGYKPSNAPAPEVQKDEAATKASKKRNIENPEMMKRNERKDSKSPLKGGDLPIKTMSKNKK